MIVCFLNAINHGVFFLPFFELERDGCGRKRSQQSKQPCYGEASAVCRGNQVNAETSIQEKQNIFLPGIIAIHDLFRDLPSVIWKDITIQLFCINFTMYFAILSLKCYCCVCNMILRTVCIIPTANGFKLPFFTLENFKS